MKRSIAVDAITSNLRQAWRRLARRPIVLVLMIASLGVGVGITISVYAVVDRLATGGWLTVSEAERVMTVRPGLSYPDYVSLSRASTAADYTIFQSASLLWAHDTGTRTISAKIVSSNYFEVAGVRLVLGRTFAADPMNPDQVVLSYSFWQQFGARAAIVGQSLTLNGWPMTIVGVLPDGFHSAVAPMLAPAIYVPVSSHVNVALEDRGAAQFDVLGRLRAGVTFAQASGELRALDARIRKEQPSNARRVALTAQSGLVSPFQGRDDTVPGLWIRAALAVINGLGTLVLLIACANVAGVLAARADERRRDLAIRAALGASRRRLIVELLGDGVLLGTISVAGAAVLWMAGIALLSRMPALVNLGVVLIPPRLPVGLLFALVILVAAVCTVAPALLVRGLDTIGSLRPSRMSLAGRRLRAPRVLAGMQICICAIFATVAIFMIRTTVSLGSIVPGFDDAHAIVVSVRLPSAAGENAALDVEAELARLNGVAAVSYGSFPGAFTAGRHQLRLDEAGEVVRAEALSVEPGFLRTLGIPIERGEDLERGDLTGRGTFTRVVVDRTFVDRYLDGRDPVGVVMTLAGDSETGARDQRVIIAGVSRVANLGGPNGLPTPLVFVPTDPPRRAATFVVRTEHTAAATVPTVVRTIGARFPGASASVTTMTDRFNGTLAPLRVAGGVLGLFAAIGALIATIGLHGLVSYQTSRRTFEIGVRVALGASKRSVVALVLRDAAAIAAGGAGLGLLLTGAAARWLPAIAGDRTVTPIDLVTAATVIAIATIMACCRPAWVALRIQAATALRTE